MPVAVHRDLDRAVPKVRLDRLGMGALGDEQRGAGVPQVVKADLRRQARANQRWAPEMPCAVLALPGCARYRLHRGIRDLGDRAWLVGPGPVEQLGYRPVDDAEAWAAEVDSAEADPTESGKGPQGGSYAR